MARSTQTRRKAQRTLRDAESLNTRAAQDALLFLIRDGLNKRNERRRKVEQLGRK